MHRLRLQFGDEKAEKMKSRAERERKHAAHMEKLEKEAAMDPNLVPVGERPSAARGASAARPIAPLDEIPEVEWWDKEFLQNGTYDDVTNGNWHVNMDKFNVGAPGADSAAAGRPGACSATAHAHQGGTKETSHAASGREREGEARDDQARID